MYNIRISTDAYQPRKATKKNWEPGTMNDFMKALNGWKGRESNIKLVRWRIELFLHGGLNYTAEQRAEAQAFLERSKITYYDKLCGFNREEYIECPGYHQGYVDIDKILDELKTTGRVKIPFCWAYDSRQYIRNMDGCYMEIEKAGSKKTAAADTGGGDDE